MCTMTIGSVPTCTSRTVLFTCSMGMCSNNVQSLTISFSQTLLKNKLLVVHVITWADLASLKLASSIIHLTVQ